MKWTAIFRSGTHGDQRGRKTTWTNRDLDKIVQEYNQRKEQKAPLAVGPTTSEIPIHGYVKQLRRSDDTLEATFDQVSHILKEASAGGRLMYKSVGLNADGTLRHVRLDVIPPIDTETGRAAIKIKDEDFGSEYSRSANEEPNFYGLTKHI
jgi:hypothetical protein